MDLPVYIYIYIYNMNLYYTYTIHGYTYKTTLPYKLLLRCHSAHIYCEHLPATSETQKEDRKKHREKRKMGERGKKRRRNTNISRKYDV